MSRTAFFRIITNCVVAVVGCYLSDVVFNDQAISKIRQVIKTIQQSDSQSRLLLMPGRPSNSQTIKPSNSQTIIYASSSSCVCS